jgi:hypothetical protein
MGHPPVDPLPLLSVPLMMMRFRRAQQLALGASVLCGVTLQLGERGIQIGNSPIGLVSSESIAYQPIVALFTQCKRLLGNLGWGTPNY